MEAGQRGKRTEYVSHLVPTAIRVWVDGREATKRRVDGEQLLHLKRVIALIFRDPNVEKVVRLHGLPESWINSSRIFEVIEGDVGGGIVSQGWATKSETTTFSRTANNPQAVGDEARHGYQRVQPPPKPITQQEASELITRITHQWINYKRHEPSLD